MSLYKISLKIRKEISRSMSKNFISAVIVAAGNSSRMGSDKIFLTLNKIPSIVYTLAAFQRSEFIDEIIIVCKENQKDPLNKILNKYSIDKFKDFAPGGKTRQESVFSGIDYCKNCNTTHFAIHDAARCLISCDEIDKVVNDAFIYGSSVLGVPCKDTIKILNEQSFVINTPNRDTLWQIQTPQVFEKDLYIKSMSIALKNRLNYTDDCQLVENLNKPVHVIRGEYSNLKLTTVDDIPVFEDILKARGVSL